MSEKDPTEEKPCLDDVGSEEIGEAEEESPEEEAPLSSPDSLVTNTVTLPSPDPSVLHGDYQMEDYKGLPELTLALIKPDGMEHVIGIERRMRNEGFNIVQKRRVRLTPEQASNFYHEHTGKPFFPLLIATMCEGPVQAYVLRRKNVVDMWRKTCGPANVEEAQRVWPDSLRAVYGTPGVDGKNVCHASATTEKALQEIRFFFPHMILDANILNETQVENYLQEYVNPTLLEGLAQVCKNKPLDPVIWLADWLLMNNPYKPKMEESITLTPT